MRGAPLTTVKTDSPAAFRAAFAYLTLGLGIVAAVLFSTFPGLDLEVSRAFYAHGGFVGQSLVCVKVLRGCFIALFWACAVLTVSGLLATWRRRGVWMRLAFPQWAFLAVCLGVGPGLIANVALKDHWGRARPREIVEFGGDKAFTPALVPTAECQLNCSFVAGEPAAIFVPFYAAAFVMPEWAVALVALGTLGGLAAGFVRIAQGGHFLSDVLFAGLLMATTTAVAYRILLAQRGRPPLVGRWRELLRRRQV
jgi:lipid A 4'-phosphatase